VASGFIDRTIARVRAHSLDERLLAGARPEENRLIRARSAELLDPGNRADIARALREMVDAAEHARRIFMKAQVRLRDLEIIRAASQIRDLCDVLEGSMPVSARGVILADRLIRDGESPMFWPSQASIEAAVTEVRAALELD
jgi:hypothetical protein